ncbi:MAG: acyl-CoA thioesterase [Exilibacterium sp.]
MEKVAPYIHWRTVSFGDTDAAAIVYTPRFSIYCMEAAEVWFREYLRFDWYHMNVEFGQGTPVVHMEMDFTAPLIGNDKLGVVVRVGKVGRSTVTLDFEGIRVRKPAAEQVATFTGRYVFCFTDKKVKGAIPIPPEQRELIQAYSAECMTD